MPVRFQVDADFYDHPKTLELSDAAVALWTRAGAYSTHKLLDGFVPDGALPRLSNAPDEASSELVRRGLWRRVRGGFQFHQWKERNLVRARVEADREYDRTRKQKQRDEARQTNQPQVNTQTVRPDIRPDVTPDSERNPYRSVSVSESVSVSVSGSGHASGGSEPPRQCPEHLDDPSPPPCGRCAEARRNHDRWQLADGQRRRDLPTCRQHRGQPADNCAMCRSERLAGERT